MPDDDHRATTSRPDVETIASESDRGHRLAEEAQLAREFARIGSLDSVPWVMVSDDARRALALDPRAASVLSHIDGRRNVAMLVEACGAPSSGVLAVIVHLARQGVIALH